MNEIHTYSLHCVAYLCATAILGWKLGYLIIKIEFHPFCLINDANLSKTIFIKEYQFRRTFCYWYFLTTLNFKTLYFLKWCPIFDDSQQVWKVEIKIMNSFLKNECTCYKYLLKFVDFGMHLRHETTLLRTPLPF